MRRSESVNALSVSGFFPSANWDRSAVSRVARAAGVRAMPSNSAEIQAASAHATS